MTTKIFSHAFKMLWNNLGNAAKVSLVPLVFITFAMIALFLLIGAILSGTGDLELIMSNQTPSAFGIFIVIIGTLLFLLVYLVGIAWMMVGWHRFVLLEEYPTSMMPKWNGLEIQAYVLHLIRIALVCLFVYVIFITVFIFIMSVSNGAIGFFMVLMIAIAPLLIALFWRITMGLPSRAIGQRLTIRGGWAVTNGMTLTLYGLGWLVVLFSIAIGIVGGILGLIPILGFIISLVIQWFSMMLNASILTTVYGYAVEGRELT